MDGLSWVSVAEITLGILIAEAIIQAVRALARAARARQAPAG